MSTNFQGGFHLVGGYFGDMLPPMFLKLLLNYGYILQITLSSFSHFSHLSGSHS